MAPYVYKPLEGPEAIRVIELLPGDGDDPLHLNLSHVNRTYSDAASKRALTTVEELEKTLPPNWWVYEAIDNRVFYYYEEDDGQNWKATWDHPDPSFDRSLYQLPESAMQRDTRDTVYEALSYTWGSISHHETAIITDQTSGLPATLSLGLNLASALRNLRRSCQSRKLWIDAICINQGDDDEKAAQVKRMADIYRHASRVVVWLGPHDSDSALAVSTLRYLGRQTLVTMDNWNFCAPGSEQPYWCEADCQLPYSTQVWKAISNLLARPWFTRVWIIQEILLANKHAVIQCGNDETSWLDLRTAIISLWVRENS
ncbi:heterokaryon incompatibility protein-domain-containing protein [Xylariaceae sp. FL0804]|nr:heterokaryon incompatibility protein-domain-containing protein [Xylariaceae sp. FL0804]